MWQPVVFALLAIATIGCGSEPAVTGSKGSVVRPLEGSTTITPKNNPECDDMVEIIGSEYQTQSLLQAEAKLKEMDIPLRERTPNFRTIVTDGVRLLKITYPNAIPDARAGDWVLLFDPKRPNDENPVDVKIWR